MVKNTLNLHYLNAGKEKPGTFQMCIEGTEFTPLKMQVTLPNSEQTVLTNGNEIRSYYLGQEMVDTGLMASYYLNIPAFSICLQRNGKEIAITSVTAKNESISAKESPLIRDFSLLGADLEVMAKNKKGAFVAIPVMKANNRTIGTDRAMIRKNLSFYQPIIELRPNPRTSGAALHKELIQLKQKLEKQAGKFNLEIIADENPKERFFLGGHFHFSNVVPTYRKVSLLDALLTLPFSANKEGSIRRRVAYGKLGAVRLNNYRGFEYRSLPSWYEFLDNGQAFFNWLDTVIFNETIPKIRLSRQAIYAYYQGDQQTLRKETEKIFQFIERFLSAEEKSSLEDWRLWLNSIRR